MTRTREPTLGARYGLEPETKISESTFDEIARTTPGITLTPESRRRIRHVVGFYERKVAVRSRSRGSVAERKLASRISKWSARLRADIPRLLEDNPLLELVIARRWPGRARKAFLLGLKYCEEFFTAFVHAKKGAVPRQGQLHLLLHRLAEIYLDSGGTSTAVSNNRRRSPFIDFAWKIIEKLPVRRRPHTRDSLAGEWQTWRANYENNNNDRRTGRPRRPKPPPAANHFTRLK